MATRRTIVIGDLHGCLDEAVELLDRAQASAADRVIFLGDLVDRGPNPAGCVDLAMAIEQRQGAPACVLGNHEEKHLEYRRIESTRGKVDVGKPTHVATRAQLRPEHYGYFAQLPLYIRLPEFTAVCVHAGAFPNRSIEKQEPRHLLHAQMLRPYVTDELGIRHVNTKTVWPSRVPKGEENAWHFWTQYWSGPETIIFGHSVLDRPLITDKAIGLDGGCCFGRELWGLILPSKEIVRIRARHPSNEDDASWHRVHGKVRTR